MPSDNDYFSSEEFLEVVAGVRCPCGHHKDNHSEPNPEVELETLGPCMLCECQGLIDWFDDGA